MKADISKASQRLQEAQPDLAVPNVRNSQPGIRSTPLVWLFSPPQYGSVKISSKPMLNLAL